MSPRLIRRGDILLTDFSPALAGEANFTRPAVVMTNNIANAESPAIVVIPLTSNLERVYPFELLIPNERSGLDRDSKAQTQFIRHVSTARIRKPLGYLPEDLMGELERRLKTHLALET
ncbi:type II toxin-antitoxin system PemK/MazF family toxin (plasmid) [Deinococcus wulumuqiensis]|uniref:mRNA interferase n=1 Tax=Deinococcus wulumuqiensis TaxID=980427 RepID=A0A345ILI0_9DEIO|nr:type II toxin-antitoxin system PemK/MazF family toxin [Deinococcus wulumuqiensis]AXH00553.1 type II toxin-antitoxin system PemK/MazF family toxin [Deinococcus wulumuqiensis]